MNNQESLIRVGDSSFAFQIDQSNHDKLNVVIKSKMKTSVNDTRKIISIISNKMLSDNKLLESGKNIYFKLNKKVFKLELSKNKESILSMITFFKNTKNPNFKEFKLTQVQGPIPGTIKLEQKAIIQDSFDIPHILPLKDYKNSLELPTFADPYTQLATLAFQKFEEDYESKDKKGTGAVQSHYILVETPNHELKLTKAGSREYKDETIHHYYQFLLDTYGKEKIEYIEKSYGLNLSEMIIKEKPLTPEIVYRINMGLGNLEIEDVKALFQKIKTLENLLDVNSSALFLEDNPSALPFLSSSLFPLSQIKGILRELSKDKEATFEDLKSWVEKLPSSFEELKPEQFNKLISILSPTREERERQYTGRKIYHPIQSSYTTGGVEKFKPWVDQQELLQIFNDLKEKNWDHYYEKICHVVCKKHLVRVHPTEMYRIGALIPAPNDSEGNERWYKVAEFVNNGRGIVSYTLKPASQYDSKEALPAIKLYRSTASDPYAMDSEASIKNDLNPLNPPGYEGSHLSEKYENEFFNKRSIPAWVAYQHQAQLLLPKMKLDSPETISAVYENLKLASNELQNTRDLQKNSLNLATLVKKYDAELNDLLKQIVNTPHHKKDFKEVFKIISKTKVEPNLNHKALQNQKKDARCIYNALQKMPDSKEKQLIMKLLDDILSPFEKENDVKGELEEFEKSNKLNREPLNSLELLQLEEEYTKLTRLHGNHTQEIAQHLKIWNAKLLGLAKLQHENIESKEPEEVVLAGHSLGGACAQRGLVQYLIEKGRVPLPNHSTHLRLFDEPGIRSSDNEAFKDFGNRHANLLQAQNSKFSITRRHETGDFVVTGGEVHLGATYSGEEDKVVESWMEFNASVQNANPETTDRSISISKTAHATQFETGKRQATWLAEESIKLLKSLPEEKKQAIEELRQTCLGDFKRTWFAPSTQGAFDMGKKSKHWKDVKKIWNLTLVESMSGEKIRKKAGKILRNEYTPFGSLKLFASSEKEKSDLHGNWINLRDGQGVFAVNENGVISK